MLNELNLRLMNLEAKSRWRRIVTALEIQPQAVVADIGPGGGFYTKALARAASCGEVYAVDIESRNLKFIRKLAERDGFVERLVLVLGQEDDSLLPRDHFDLIFSSNAYHHIKNTVAYFRSIARALKRKGRVVVIDYDGSSGWMPKHGHSTSPERIRNDLERAGLRLVEKLDLLPGQSFQSFAQKSA